MSDNPFRSIETDQFQPVQESLSEVLGVNIGLVSAEGKPLTRSVDVQRSPWSLLTGSPKGFARYAECLQALLRKARSSKTRPLVTVNVANLHLGVVPVESFGKPVAYFLVGPFLVGQRGQPDDYIALAREFDVQIDRWMEMLQEIRIFSFTGITAAATLLYQMGQLFNAPISDSADTGQTIS